MLFNTYEFVLLFLPLCLALFFLIPRFLGARAAAAWLALASLFFYAYWSPKHLALLLLSIALNYSAGLLIFKWRLLAPKKSQTVVTLAVVANLTALAYFKYADFLVSTANGMGLAQLPLLQIVLPIGISFFTFTQIAFLVDVNRGIAREVDFIHYLLFVTYFPHLIAGPVLHHKEMMPQFKDPITYTPVAENISTGLVIFSIGLAKKVLLADSFADYANPVFSHAEQGHVPSLIPAWIGVVAYTLQLYFDFSGYSDMAIGLSRMFGVQLPLNFNSPYRSTSIIDFWRRWHMTLSRFLRDYLYVALGGNRKGALRRQLNLMTTMVLGGLWHGANWTFVVWGTLHGLYLIANHAWQSVLARWGFPASEAGPARKMAGWLATLLAVMLAWVFFRASSIEAAMLMLRGLAGLGPSIHAVAGNPSPIADFGAVFMGYPVPIDDWLRLAVKLAIAWAVVLALPNTQSLPLHRVIKGLPGYFVMGSSLIICLLLLAINASRGASEFIYFNF